MLTDCAYPPETIHGRRERSVPGVGTVIYVPGERLPFRAINALGVRVGCYVTDDDAQRALEAQLPRATARPAPPERCSICRGRHSSETCPVRAEGWRMMEEVRVCIDCGEEFRAVRRNGSRPRRCLRCGERWCRARAWARLVTDEDVRRVKGLLSERAPAGEVARSLGLPVRTLRHIEDQALRHFIGGMRRAARVGR